MGLYTPTVDKFDPEDLAENLILIDVDAVELWDGNPNEADAGAIHQSMERFGDLVPILVTTDQHGRRLVIDGNHRVLVERQARRFGGKLAAIDLTSLGWTDLEALAAGLTMNSTSRAGRDDPTLMAAALMAIRAEDPTLLEAMSVTEGDIETLLRSAGTTYGEGGRLEAEAEVPVDKVTCPNCGHEFPR